MRFPWPRRRHDNRNASNEAKSARVDAERSKRQAERDKSKARREWTESLPLVEQIKTHNEANHYDQWLHRQLGNGRS